MSLFSNVSAFDACFRERQRCRRFRWLVAGTYKYLIPTYHPLTVIQGGGHGALTNTMGMGVDRVVSLQVFIFSIIL